MILMGILAILKMAFAMLWEILLGFDAGFLLSGVVQAVVSKAGNEPAPARRFAEEPRPGDGAGGGVLVVLLRGDSPGAVDFQGGETTASMVFELASTNLVIELGLILLVLMGWPLPRRNF